MGAFVLAAAALAAQLALFVTASDEAVLDVAQAALRVERDRALGSRPDLAFGGAHAARAEVGREIDARFSDPTTRSEILTSVRSSLASPGVLGAKGVAILLLLACASALVTNRRRLARTLAVFVALVSTLGALGAFGRVAEEIDALPYLSHTTFLVVDGVVLAAFVIAALAAWIVVARASPARHPSPA